PPPPGMRPIPCSGMDLGARDPILTIGLIVDARLDARQLEETLTILIEKKFPRAGARIAVRNGVHEFQVPTRFGPEMPAVEFTVEDHPEAYIPGRSFTSPAPDGRPFLIKLPDMAPYLRHSSCPKSVEAFIETKCPLVHVHVVTFDDLTFIGVTNAHVAFDAVGTGTLLDAWTRVINGTDINDIVGMKWDTQAFQSFAGPTKVAKQRGWYDLGLVQQVLFIACFVWRIFWDPKEVEMYVRVPKAFLADSKREIMENLKNEGSTEWVGSSDVLTAWWYKGVMGHRKDSTPIHIHLPINLHGKPEFPVLSSPYINNTVLSIGISPNPPNAFRKESVGQLALRFRRVILAYNADPAGMLDDVHWRCAYPGKMLFPCPPGADYSFQSSWRAASFGALDFSGAQSQIEGKQPGKARVVFVCPVLTSGKAYPLRGSGAVLMEDEDVIW
ncbi:hypothetical protein FB45DRAFT_1141595, partial [Roridomyces roridus]